MKRKSVLWQVVLICGTLSQIATAQWVQTTAPKTPIVYWLAVAPNAVGGSNLFAGTNGSGISFLG